MKFARTCAVLALLWSTFAVGLEFSDAEREAIARHGPWPPRAVRDPTNRHSGRPAAIAFGRALFFDARLSLDRTHACGSCHKPELAWTDGQARSSGRERLDRNAPSIANSRFERWFGRDGGADSLWSHALRPLTDSREMAMSVPLIAARVRDHTDLRRRYERAFGKIADDDETVAVDVAKAIAAFQETVVTGRTPFDDFRDALLRGDARAMARYPESAQRGLKIFIGRGDCSVCHFGPRFTNGEFADIGIPYFAAPGRVDPGRHAGIRHVKASPYNLESRWNDDESRADAGSARRGPKSQAWRHDRYGRWNDDASRASAVPTRHLRLEHRHWGEFKVPSLRNVALTAPYMHAGSHATLAEVVQHYSELNEERLHADGERILKPLRLSAQESADLVAFLESLSERKAAARAR